MASKPLTADNLFDILHRADLEHDSNTGDNNNDRVTFLEQALELLEKNGLLKEYAEGLLDVFDDLDEYAGLHQILGHDAPRES